MLDLVDPLPRQQFIIQLDRPPNELGNGEEGSQGTPLYGLPGNGTADKSTPTVVVVVAITARARSRRNAFSPSREGGKVKVSKAKIWLQNMRVLSSALVFNRHQASNFQVK